MFKIITTKKYNALLEQSNSANLNESKAVFLEALLDNSDRVIRELSLQLHNLTAKRVIITSKKPKAKKVSKQTNDKK
jgi:hypothetical protein